jgi:hypothetical protein
MRAEILTDLICQDLALRTFFQQGSDSSVYRRLIETTADVSEWWVTVLEKLSAEEQETLISLAVELEQISIQPNDESYILRLLTGCNGKPEVEDIDPNTDGGLRSLKLLLYFVENNSAWPGVYFWCFAQGLHTTLPYAYNCKEAEQTVQFQQQCRENVFNLGKVLCNGEDLVIPEAITEQAARLRAERAGAIIVSLQNRQSNKFYNYAFLDGTWLPFKHVYTKNKDTGKDVCVRRILGCPDD